MAIPDPVGASLQQTMPKLEKLILDSEMAPSNLNATAKEIFGDPLFLPQSRYAKKIGEIEYMIGLYKVMKSKGSELDGDDDAVRVADKKIKTSGHDASAEAVEGSAGFYRRGSSIDSEVQPEAFWRWMQDKSVDITASPTFKKLYAVVIICNSWILWVSADTNWLGSSLALVADVFFTALFLIEIILRILAQRELQEAWDSAMAFDAALVFVSLVDLLILSPLQSKLDLRVLSHMRILRLLRAGGNLEQRLNRSSQGRTLRLVVRAMGSATVSFFSVLLTLFSCMYLVAISMRSLLGDQEIPGVPHFRTLPSTMMALTEFTLCGQPWAEVYHTMRESESASIQLAAPILFGWIFLVRIVLVPSFIGFFVENLMNLARTDAAEVNERKLAKRIHVPDLRRILEICDQDDNNRISREEFLYAMHMHRVELAQIGMPTMIAKQIWSTLEPDDTGEIPIDTFLVGYLKYYGFTRTIRNMCVELGLKAVQGTIAARTHRTDAIVEVTERIIKKLEFQEVYWANSVERRRVSLRTIHKDISRIENMGVMLMAGLETPRGDMQRVAEVYQSSADAAATVSGMRRLTVQDEVSKTLQAAVEWARSLGLEV